MLVSEQRHVSVGQFFRRKAQRLHWSRVLSPDGLAFHFPLASIAGQTCFDVPVDAVLCLGRGFCN